MSLVAEDGKDPANSDAPENNTQYTTVYVGNLAPEVRYSSSFLNSACKGNSKWCARSLGVNHKGAFALALGPILKYHCAFEKA